MADYNYKIVLGASYTGLTLVQTVKDTDDVTITGLTKSFTEIGGGDYVALIEGLDADFLGYSVITNSAGGGHLAVASIRMPDASNETINIQDDDWSMT
jgi:hypothetical protein